MWKRNLSSSVLLTFGITIAALVQAGGWLNQRVPPSSTPELDMVEGGMPEITAPRNEYSFARLVYSGGEDGPNNWTTDSPKADVTFVAGVKRLTNIDIREKPFYIPLASKEIFKYPFLYGVEVGHMELSQEEANILREYLFRGGFFVVDDFHGTYEWANFEEQIRK